VLAARMDRLPPEEKHLLQTAAVIGHEVPLPLLRAIAICHNRPADSGPHGVAHSHCTVPRYGYDLLVAPA
jgi:hypothetical protein